MGRFNPLDHPSQSECDSTGPSLHLPIEEIQLGRQGQERQRIPVDDGCADAGQ